MELSQKLKNTLESKSFITTAQILECGVSKTTVTAYVKNGLLVRVGHGIYTLPNVALDDMFLFSLKFSKIIFSHETALFLNGLSNRTPFSHYVTIPSSMTASTSLKSECVCFYVKPDLLDLGVTERKTTFGNLVKCYNVERTVCDLLRSRSRIDEETLISAIRNYAAYTKKDLNLLASYAETFGISKILKRYMEVLL